MLSIEKCLDMQARARKNIPGMTQLLSKRPDMFSLGVWPAYYDKAKGCRVWDLDGNEYLDMSISGIGANVLGYADPDVDAAVIDAIKRGSSCSLNSPEEVELAELLCEMHPWAEMVRFARTGGESMAIAVRIARAFTGRDKIAFCGYHGWHDWYLAANLSTDELGEHLIPGLDPTGVPRGLEGTAIPFQYNSVEQLQSIVSSAGADLGAIVVESTRGEQPTADFLSALRNLSDESGAVLIVDEISAGFRMNTGGAHIPLKLDPDIAVFSKALGNGYPIGAIIGKSSVMQAAQKTFISSTNWTERVGFAAAIATIKKHSSLKVYEHLIDAGTKVSEGWLNSARNHGIEISVGGMAAMPHFGFKYKNGLELKALYIQEMLSQGFLASNLFYAMYAHTDTETDQYLSAVDTVFSAIAEAQRTNSVSNILLGAPASAGFKRLVS